MDGTQLVRFAILIYALALTACGQPKTSEEVFPTLSDECRERSIAKRYVVRWNDSTVTLLKAESDEDVRRNFVEKNLAKLERVEPDFRVSLARESNLHTRAGVRVADNWGAARVNAGGAWAKGANGQGIVVAVVDTGVDLNHSQLASQIEKNSGEMGLDARSRNKETNGVDDDKNGFVDDVAGYDFAGNSAQVQDYDSHGTHVSGIIAANHSDLSPGQRNYVQGIAPQAKILPLAFIDSSGSGSLYDAMKAIDYAVTRKVQVINASWGGSVCSKILRDQIAGLADKGIIFVSAAGNAGSNIDFVAEYPAAFNLPSQLTVGAVGTFDNRADFSNYGVKNVHIFAPGVDIISTVPGNSMEAMSGTSMATPLMAGAVAALLSHRPNATYEQIRDALFGSARTDRSYQNQSHGRADLGAAINLIDLL